MDVDSEILDIREDWANQEQEREQQRAEALRLRLEKRRETLRNREWKPDCTCDDCLRAVLTLDPSTVCEQGKRRGQWWL
jgi:hypothetical protein